MARNEIEKVNSDAQVSGLLKPLSWRGFPIWLVYLAAVLGVAYLLNPTMGVFEILPDNLPFVGNLDEGVATMLVWYGLVEFFEGRKAASPD